LPSPCYKWHAGATEHVLGDHWQFANACQVPVSSTNDGQAHVWPANATLATDWRSDPETVSQLTKDIVCGTSGAQKLHTVWFVRSG